MIKIKQFKDCFIVTLETREDKDGLICLIELLEPNFNERLDIIGLIDDINFRKRYNISTMVHFNSIFHDIMSILNAKR